MTLLYCLFGLLLCVPYVFAGEEKTSFIAPSQLANTTMAMHSAGFWISRHPAADQVIASPQEITALNARMREEQQLTKDVFALTQNFKTENLPADFEKKLAELAAKGYYTTAGVRNDADFVDEARRNMNLPGMVLGVAPRYGLVTRYADLRFLPTSAGLYESAGDVDFDQLQNSSLDVGEAVAVVHQSGDKKWYYCFSSTADGWVEAKRVALGDEKTVRTFVQSKDFLVATKAKSDLYLDENMARHLAYVRMGTRLPLVRLVNARANVLIPVAGKGGTLQVVNAYVNRNEFHKGYLPYTARSIYQQAFAMLNQPYGWGGMYGEQDCSALLDEIFATVGIILPRDSSAQAQVGRAVAIFDGKSRNEQKIESLRALLPSGVILPMKGHIMLYLGLFDGRPYALHAIWAYREPKGGKDIPRVINRVVVSDLSLGEGSQKGSLLMRLSKVIEVQ